MSGVGNHYLVNKDNWSQAAGLMDKGFGGEVKGSMAREFMANHRAFGQQMAGRNGRKGMVDKGSKCSNINLNIKEMKIVGIEDRKD